jgi:hypothetical protein
MLFAFHEPWEPDEEKDDKPFPWPWLALAVAGLLLGFILYWLLVPMGGANLLARPAAGPAASPTISATASEAGAMSQPAASECSPAAPADSLATFIGAINNSNYEAAWELAGANHRQQAYNGALSQFTLTWAAWQGLTLGQTTMTLPQPDQAVALAQVNYGGSSGQQVDLRVELRLDADQCRWFIEDVNPLQPPAGAN